MTGLIKAELLEAELLEAELLEAELLEAEFMAIYPVAKLIKLSHMNVDD